MLKFVLILSVLLVLVSGVASLRSRHQQAEVQRLEKSPDAGTLKWYADLAKAKGETGALFSAGLPRYVAVNSLDEGLAHFTVLIGKPLARKSYATGSRTITTWYRFEVVKMLSERDTTSCITCPRLPDGPSDFLRMTDDEILIPRLGGSISLEGIRLTSIEADFPDFKPAHQYLMFLAFNSATRVGTLQMGPWGVFEVDSDSNIRPLNAGPRDRLGRDIQERFGNSVPLLQNHISQIPR